MDRLIEKLRRLIISACEQVLVASVLAFHVITFALLTIPESIASATSLGDLIWDQFSTPSPHLPAGDLTFQLIKIWTNHVVDVELPRFADLATRFDSNLALSLRSLERRSDRARTSLRSLLVRVGFDRFRTCWLSLSANRSDRASGTDGTCAVCGELLIWQKTLL